jgi:hypothetical protein
MEKGPDGGVPVTLFQKFEGVSGGREKETHCISAREAHL